MFEIHNGGRDNILTVQVRSLTDGAKFAWDTEIEAVEEYHKQKAVYPHIPLVVIERISFGHNRIVLDDRKSRKTNE